MKNKIFTFLLTFFYFEFSYSENLSIEAKNISIDKKKILLFLKMM